MGPIFTEQDGALRCRYNAETIRIDAWGADGLRVRGSVGQGFRDEALSALLAEARCRGQVTTGPDSARIENGRLACEVFIVNTHGEPKQELNLRFVDRRTGDCGLVTRVVSRHWTSMPDLPAIRD